MKQPVVALRAFGPRGGGGGFGAALVTRMYVFGPPKTDKLQNALDERTR